MGGLNWVGSPAGYPHEKRGGQLLDLGSQPGSKRGESEDMGFAFQSNREKSYTNAT